MFISQITEIFQLYFNKYEKYLWTLSEENILHFPKALRNRSRTDQVELVSGRADWALGYDPVGNERTLLSAIEAKQRAEFSRDETQRTDMA